MTTMVHASRACAAVLRFEGSQTAANAINPLEKPMIRAAVDELVGRKAGSIYAATHNTMLRRSLHESARIDQLLQNATLTQNWAARTSLASQGHGRQFVQQLQQVAQVIASRHAFEAERDMFYVELPGFDHHAEVVENLKTKFKDINIALSTFVAEMRQLGVWDSVALQSLSEFGRTLTSNGLGTDHAWGGNQFLIGGNIKGGVLHGAYPELRVNGPNSISSTGPMLPSLPWEVCRCASEKGCDRHELAGPAYRAC